MKKKSKIILAILVMALLVSSVVFATEVTTELDLETKASANLEDTVGTDEEPTSDVNYDDQVAPISIDPSWYRGEIEDSDGSLSIDPSWYRGEGEELERGDVFILQTNSVIENTIDGNLFVMGNDINISGDVNGNVFALGKNVKISSNITGSVFVATEKLDIVSGTMQDVYFCASEDINIESGAVILREAKMMAEKNINLQGSIWGNAYTSAEKITLGDLASISGKLVYTGEVEQKYEGQIGSLEKQEINVEEVKSGATITDKLQSVLTKTVTALCIIGLIVLATNRKVEFKPVTVGEAVKTTLKGILWMIAIPVIIFVLILTIVGIPFALILLILYILMFFAVLPAVSIQISSYILKIKEKDSKVLLWLLATIIYAVIALLRLIPVLDVVIPIVLGAYGFDLIIKTIFPKKEKEVVVETKTEE